MAVVPITIFLCKKISQNSSRTSGKIIYRLGNKQKRIRVSSSLLHFNVIPKEAALPWPLAELTEFIGYFYWFVCATFCRQLCQENTVAFQRRGLREAEVSPGEE